MGNFNESEHPRDEDGRFIASGVSQSFAEILAENGGNHYDAAKQYYKNNLQGKYIIGLISGKPVNIHFTGDSWRELKRSMKNDSLKAELVEKMPEVISEGEYIKNPLYKHHGGAKGFHTFMKSVQTSKGEKEVMVDVVEMPAAKYRHSAYNMTHEDMPAHNTKKAALGIKPKTASDARQEGNINSGYSPSALMSASEKTVSNSLEVVNIRIAGEEIKDPDQAALDHFCRRIAELGMDIFGLRKGA